MLNIILPVLLGSLFGIPIAILLAIRFVLSGFTLFQSKPRNSPPKIVLDPSLGKHKFVSVNGVNLHYVESGSTDKPLILFVHGFPEFWFSWRHQIKYFNKHYHVVAFDMRGYGESSKPAGVSNYSMVHLVEDIRALVQHLGKNRFNLVAHDWGGAVSWNFAAKYPDMLMTYTSCNIPHLKALRKQQMGSVEQMLKSWYILFFQCPLVPELINLAGDMQIFYTILKDSGLHKDEELVEAYKYAFKDFTTWNRAINYYRGALRDARSNPFTQLLGDIKVPVLQIFGTGDKYLSVAAAQGSAKYVRDHQLELLEGVSHWVQQQAPDTVNSLIHKFIKQKA